MAKNNENVISKRTGVIIFIFLILASLVLFFFIARSQSKATPAPEPTASQSASPTPSPIPTVFYKGDDDQTDVAMFLALRLTGRNWQNNINELTKKINDDLDVSLIPKIKAFMATWDWSNCVKTKCLIVPEATNITQTGSDSGGWDMTVEVTTYDVTFEPLGKQIWRIHMVLQPNGSWKATSISGPGLP